MITAERRSEIARLGGKALRPEQRSFSQNRQLASEAGRKGGLTPRKLKPKLTPAEVNRLCGEIADEILIDVSRGA